MQKHIKRKICQKGFAENTVIQSLLGKNIFISKLEKKFSMNLNANHY